MIVCYCRETPLFELIHTLTGKYNANPYCLLSERAYKIKKIENLAGIRFTSTDQGGGGRVAFPKFLSGEMLMNCTGIGKR